MKSILDIKLKKKKTSTDTPMTFHVVFTLLHLALDGWSKRNL